MRLQGAGLLTADLESLNRILKHPIRRKIVLALLEKKDLAYVDLMNLTEVDNTGKLNYHLKILGDLICKNGSGKYLLTEKGQLASQILLKFPEKKPEHSSLRGGDAILIGSVVFLLALANPGILSIFLVISFGIGALYVGGIVILVYSLLAPGAAIWWLVVRRTRSHDPYDLFKPPLVSLALFAVLLISVILLRVTLTISVTVGNSGRVSVEFLNMLLFIMYGVSSFIGVAIFEILDRVRERKF